MFDMTKSGQTYMKATYKDGYKGLICQGKITKYVRTVRSCQPNGLAVMFPVTVATKGRLYCMVRCSYQRDHSGCDGFG